MAKESRNQISQGQFFNNISQLPNTPSFPATLPALLEQAVQQAPNSSLIFIENEQFVVVQSYGELLTTAQKILAGLRNLGAVPQDKFLLLLPDNQQLITAFWGCILGGFVPLIMEVPPSYEESNPALDKLELIWHFLDRPLIIANTQLIANFPAVAIEELLDNKPDRSFHQPQPDDLAFLTLSSGSTGVPKCIQLTHRNLITRIGGANLLNRHQPDEIILNWLPFDHIGSISDWHLRPLALGCKSVYVRKEYILGRPLTWLDLIDKYRVTHSWAPNFAYTLINELLSGQVPQKWDLSCVRFLLTEGESVDVNTVQSFLDKLQIYGLPKTAIRPAFGMAELGSGITYYQPRKESPLLFHCLTKSSLKGKIKRTRPEHSNPIIFTDLGETILGVEIRIVDGKKKVLKEDTIGHLQVKGDVVFAGYYNNPSANREAFTKDGWFNTGDLGFISQGHLIVTGRAKETIIINGTNYYSQEIETVVEAIAGVEASYTAACAVSSADNAREQLAIFFHCSFTEMQPLTELIRQIRRTVIKKVGVNPDYLIPVAKEAIPKTAIGKIQRQQLSKLFAVGKFKSILEEVKDWLSLRDRTSHKTELETQIAQIWQQVLGVETVGIDDNFFELGGNSLLLIQLQTKLEAKFKRKLAVADLFKYPNISAQAKYFAQKKSGDRRQLQPLNSQPPQTGEIAVIGISCRFPRAKNIEQFWQNMRNGVESTSFFTEAEILATGVSPDLLSNPNYVKARPILEDIELFDAEFFGYSPKEAELIDPQQRLFLECAWESLEDAGYNPWGYAGKIGIYAGAVMNTYLLNNIYPQRHQIDISNDLQVTTLDSMGGFQMMMGNDKDYLTTRVSYKLNLTGPSVNVQTACSTSLVAVHLAKQSLLNGECDLALAGGVSLQIPQKIGYLYQEGMIVSPDGHCRAFDRLASGTIFGNGVGIVVLKRLEQAIADGDRIYAVIKGSAINNDGGTKVGYLAPNGEGQSRVVAEAIAQAGIEADTIGYLETHGTGTILGDPIEIAGLTQGFRATTAEKQFCAIGSVKTNIGHLQIASGIAGFIKTVLCLYHRQIPPSLHFTEPSPQIDFANSPFYVNTTLQDWQPQTYPRRAGVNSLGVGGTNAHVILEEVGAHGVRPSQDEPPSHVLTLSAKSEKALQDLVENYITYLDSHREDSLADICFTANTGRCHFSHRLAIVAESIEQLLVRLKNTPIAPKKNNPNKQIAFLFTGQGSQYLNMGRQLYETQPIFQQNVDRCAKILQPYLDRPLLEILYPQSKIQNLKSKIDETVYTQPALFTLEYSLYQLWKSWGIEATAVMGHSFGEYVAACVAGVFSLEDALKLVVYRGKLIQTLPQGAMVTAFAPLEIVQQAISIVRSNLAIAAINGEKNIVISGTKAAIDRVVDTLQTQGFKTKRLNSFHPFHSHLLEPILAEFEQITRQVTYAPPQIDLISNLTGELVTEEIATPEYWCQHLCQTVQFAKSLETLHQEGYQIFLECGSQPILLSMGRLILEKQKTSDFTMWLPSLRKNRSDWQQILDSLGQLFIAGIEIDWSNFYTHYSHRKLSLPTYPFQRERYWIDRELNSLSNKQNTSFTSQLEHPLLGQRLVSPLPEIIFPSQLNLAHLNYLKDHRLGQQVVFPGAAYLEMACAAIALVNKSSQIVMEDVVIPQALILSENSSTTIQLIVQQNSWKIYSLAEDQNWTLHCQGKINAVRETINNLQKINLDQLKNQLSLLPISLEKHYQYCQQRNLNYGVTFQGIQQLWRKDGQALGNIELPCELKNTDAKYHIHPALLDACFQVIFAALPEHLQTETYLPISLERLSFYSKPDSQLWSYVKLKYFSDTIPEIIQADVEIFDRKGNLAIKVEGLNSKRISSVAISQKTNSQYTNSLPNWQDWLYQIKWQNQPRINSLSIKEKGTWLIFSERNLFAQKIVQLLEAQQQECLLIYPGQDWQKAIENQKSNLRGVVYLWGLENLELEQSLQQGLKNALELVQQLVKKQLNSCARLWLVTQESQTIKHNNPTLTKGKGKDTPSPDKLVSACLWGLGKVIALEHPELKCVCIDLDTHSDAKELFEEIWLGDTENQIAFRDGMRWVARLSKHQIDYLSQQPLRLDISSLGSIENLQWQPITRRTLTANEVEIKVRAAGLNFRDVLNVLDLYPGVAGLLGMECVGEIVAVGEKVDNLAVGDEVVAITSGCLSNYITVNAASVIPKPNHLNLAETVTMTGAFLTAYYTLVHLGKLKKGDRILIHAAAGGVGLAAIQIAQKVGAEIFATASPSKWKFLQSLGVKHLFNSRNLDFAKEIISITQGKGVDLVLNSLAGEFIPSSLEILNPDGCFIEIGKQNIWDKQKVSLIKPNASYLVVDLLEVVQQQADLIQKILPQIMEKYQPLPYQIFPAHLAQEAFRYMAGAKHIGKIVISFPINGLRSDATYLITGGLGGLGLTVAEWMVNKGAKHLVLLGRREIKETIKSKLETLEKAGAKIIIAQTDISDRVSLAQIISQIDQSLPPLRGIIHAAGILDDGVLQQQTWDSFDKVCQPKIQGAWNLHTLTLNHSLDFFVLFSSVASILGSTGQANYSAANSFLDALAHTRQGMGLPALSINWGAWNQVGMAAQRQMAQELEQRGMASLEPKQGLSILEKLLDSTETQVGVWAIDWAKYTQNRGYSSFLADITQPPTPKERSILAQLATASPNVLPEILLDYVRSEIAQVLGLRSSISINPDGGFSELGLDSLQSVELSNRLQANLGCKLSATIVFDYPTLKTLVNYLLEKFSPKQQESKEVKIDKQFELTSNLIQELSEAEAEALLLSELEMLGEG